MFIQPIEEINDFDRLKKWFGELQRKILEDDLSGSDTWNPGSISDGGQEAMDVTVTGAQMGDYAIASFSLDVTDLVLDAQVTAADTVTCVLVNTTGAPVNLASGTIYVRVFRRTLNG